MAELIAQGTQSQQRWRRPLRLGDKLVIGRDAGEWSVAWDEFVSRAHVEADWDGRLLRIRRLENSLNPLFHQGRERLAVDLQPGENFVIGQTTITLVGDQVQPSSDSAGPVEEQSFSAQYLHKLPFRNSDERLEVLTRLPEVIRSSGDDRELFARIVQLLLSGIRRADTVAFVSHRNSHDPLGQFEVLHWDRRRMISGDFHPSQRLVRTAIEQSQSVLHVWNRIRERTQESFTMVDNVDWAYCTPVLVPHRPGWVLYVSGTFARDYSRPNGVNDDLTPTDPHDLREDLKFTELVAATIRSLRQAQALERKQATLSRFFAPPVLEAIGGDDPQAILAPRETEVSVLFCDLRGFSRASEQSAGDLLGLLQRVSKALGVATHHILDQGGVFGDFQGDAAMGFWGWPLPQHDKVLRACQTALAIGQAFAAASHRSEHPLANFQMGIGVATGRAVAGQIGTSDQVKVTVFGPLVNRASRLEGMTKLLGVSILIDEATAQVLRAHVPATVARVRRVAIVRPYGMEQTIDLNELLAPVSEDPSLTDEYLVQYELALDEFLARRWAEASKRLRVLNTADRVREFLLSYMASHDHSVPSDWDGVITLTSKG